MPSPGSDGQISFAPQHYLEGLHKTDTPLIHKLHRGFLRKNNERLRNSQGQKQTGPMHNDSEPGDIDF
jgi:hypothetical protein